jgi:hypothetical protein
MRIDHRILDETIKTDQEKVKPQENRARVFFSVEIYKQDGKKYSGYG